jgi:hypothetical protein
MGIRFHVFPSCKKKILWFCAINECLFWRKFWFSSNRGQTLKIALFYKKGTFGRKGVHTSRIRPWVLYGNLFILNKILLWLFSVCDQPVLEHHGDNQRHVLWSSRDGRVGRCVHGMQCKYWRVDSGVRPKPGFRKGCAKLLTFADNWPFED